MTRERPFELSRRKVLASLGAVGAASAGAGLGTTAYFSDEETYKNNSLTAGELDLKAKWEVSYYGANEQLEEHVVSTSEDFDALACGADFDRPEINLQDMKPGDEVLARFDLLNCTNPGLLWMNGGVLENTDNGLTEPESKDDDEPGPSVSTLGEIPQTLRAQIYVLPGQSSYNTSVEEIVGFGNTSQATGVQTVFPAGGVTLEQAMGTLATGLGLPLQGDATSSVQGARNCFSGANTPSASAHQVALQITTPVDHGNEIQSDSFELDVGFYGEQCRHNDGAGIPAEDVAPAISAANSNEDATSTHAVQVPVGAISGFSGPTGLDTLEITYPSDFDVSPATSAGGVIEESGGGTTPLMPSVSTSGQTVTLSYGGETLEAGDTIVAFVNSITNASTAGDYTIEFDVNGSDAGSATLTITAPT